MTSCWSNDEPFVLMTYFDIMTNILRSGQTDFLKSWRVYDIITNLWHHNKHNVSNIFYVMVNVLTLWKFVMTWHTIWCHSTLFNFMTYFMTCLLLSWHLFFIISGAKYFENVCLMSLTSWYFWLRDKTYFWRNAKLLYRPDIFVHHFGNKILWKRVFDVIDIMIYFWFYGKLLTSWQTFCHHAMFLINFLTSWQIVLTSWYVFDIMTNFVTFWQIYWRHDVFLTS